MRVSSPLSCASSRASRGERRRSANTPTVWHRAGEGRALPLARRTRLTSCTVATERIDEALSQLTLTALLGQYRECSAQHMHSYTLTWQVPAFTIGVSGVLVAATFGYDVPEVVRAVISAVGAIFVFAMTVPWSETAYCSCTGARISSRSKAGSRKPVSIPWSGSSRDSSTKRAQERFQEADSMSTGSSSSSACCAT